MGEIKMGVFQILLLTALLAFVKGQPVEKPESQFNNDIEAQPMIKDQIGPLSSTTNNEEEEVEMDEDLEEPVETQSVERPSKHFVPIYVAVPTVLSTNLAGPNQMLNNIPHMGNVVGPNGVAMNIGGYANEMQMNRPHLMNNLAQNQMLTNMHGVNGMFPNVANPNVLQRNIGYPNHPNTMTWGNGVQPINVIGQQQPHQFRVKRAAWMGQQQMGGGWPFGGGMQQQMGGGWGGGMQQQMGGWGRR